MFTILEKLNNKKKLRLKTQNSKIKAFTTTYVMRPLPEKLKKTKL